MWVRVLDWLKRKLAVKVLNDILKDEVEHMPKNWKTSLAGGLTILGVLAHAGLGLLHGAPVDWTQVIAGITVGLGLFHAADATSLPK